VPPSSPDPSRDATLTRIEAAIRSDPGRRGLLGAAGPPLGLGELAAAARSLAETGRHAVLLTGFSIPTADPPAAETDGPPGAVALAETLNRLGIAATLVTDPFCGSALRAAAGAAGLPKESVCVLRESGEFPDLLAKSRPPVSHLVAIERVGPGYDHELVRTRCGEAAAAKFLAVVPRELWSRCLNMRGLPIEEWTVDFSAAFESPPPDVTTIGLGDGGNELGLGKFCWDDLAARLDGVADPRILCRVAANHTVLAGTSNWAAYGLAAATAVAAGRPSAFAPVTPAAQAHVIAAMVKNGPAVDGVTRRFEPTVDGLTPAVYDAPLVAIRAALGFDA
jgi:hypothetical protein